MTLEAALWLSECLLALALLQAAAEHLAEGDARPLYALRAALCLALLARAGAEAVLAGLFATSLLLLHRWQGPYNGGSDRMGLLILFCLMMARLFPGQAELALGYLAAQLVLSYAVSGWVKIVNPDWRSGRALSDVFRFSAYPVAEDLRGLAARRGLLRTASWGVMGLELLFPLALTSPLLLVPALCATAAFHLANACVFGLNRFLWTWLAAYPSLIWLQGRLFG
ncbi:HTTM domain-containing protein [Poseidonocella sp. HB161398]|uniref:HTTM domain-containing protein n=1 Tax=Poseidonocella sp. HB161398 TaxID=2320855 RepID=UPI0011098BA8|nr:HTTM domain-containing protein [Poseidonocella sp. HB161398]